MSSTSRIWDGQSLLIGEIKGIPVGLHFTLLVLGLIQWLYFMIAHGAVWFFVGFIFILTYWLILLLHELSHVGVAWRLGGDAERIILWPFGGLSFCRHSGDTQDRLKILLAGPFSHVVFGSVALLCYAIFHNASSVLSDYFGYCCHVHLQLFLLNLLVPAHPLDGSSCLALMCLASYSADTTAKIFVALSVPYLIFLAWWGFDAWNFGAILLLFWLAAQSLDLCIRIRQGPAGLARHPIMSIAEQMKPKKSGSGGSGNGGPSINVDTWSMAGGTGVMMGPQAGVGGGVQNWGSGTSGTNPPLQEPQSPGGVPVVGVPTTRAQAEATGHYPQKDSEIPTGHVIPPGGGNQAPEMSPNNVVITENISAVPTYNMAQDDTNSEIPPAQK